MHETSNRFGSRNGHVHKVTKPPLALEEEFVVHMPKTCLGLLAFHGEVESYTMHLTPWLCVEASSSICHQQSVNTLRTVLESVITARSRASADRMSRIGRNFDLQPRVITPGTLLNELIDKRLRFLLAQM